MKIIRSGVFPLGIGTTGTRGDIQPYIALAKELNQEGYNTIIASHPCWQELVQSYNVTFAPIGPDIDIKYESSRMRCNSRHWIIGVIKTMKFMMKIIENSSAEIIQLCKDVDLVIASHSHMGAAEAEACNLTYISVTLQPTSLPEKLKDKTIFKSFANKLIGAIINPLMVRPYNKIRKKLGLEEVNNFYDLVSPYLNLIPISPVVYPPIIISLGAMGFESEEEKAKLDIFINLIDKTGIRAIIQGFNRTLKEYSLPENIMSIGNVPHGWLFKHAYCVIHHGGLSTTAAVLKAGAEPLKSEDLSQESLVERIKYIQDNYKSISDNVKLISKNINNENGLKKSVELINEKISIN